LLTTSGSEAFAKDVKLANLFLKAIAKELKDNDRPDDEALIKFFEAAFPDQPDHQEMALRFMELLDYETTPTLPLLLQDKLELKPKSAPANWHLSIPPTEEEAFETETLPGGSVRIVALKDAFKKRREISIPALIGGAKVEEIGKNLFYENRDGNEIVTKIVIPENVSVIQEAAFYSCKKLTHVKLPESLRVIGKSAFYDCPKLQYINLPDGLETIEGYAFSSCYKAFAALHLPPKLTKIANGAFRWCRNIKSVVIPKSICEIGSKAFYLCSALKSIIIPESICKIGGEAFNQCSALKSITILNPEMIHFELSQERWEPEALLKTFNNISPNAVLKVPKALLAEYAKLLELSESKTLRLEEI
jgi:hypothetical protein